MAQEWSREYVINLIANGIEENLQLEYKSAGAVGKNDQKKTDISITISGMANAAGGVVIFGIKEFDEKEKRHLPEKIDPINRQEFTKEWLEQIIHSNIKPKIEGLKINPIDIDVNSVVYIVEVPQSTTAHQAPDHRYYKRRNFQSSPMDDYEIRDIMNRVSHPIITLDFEIVKRTFEDKPHFPLPESAPFTLGGIQFKPQKKFKTTWILYITFKNSGKIYAQYINYFVTVPDEILDSEDASGLGVTKFSGANTHRDMVEYNQFGSKYGPSRYKPLLPGLSDAAKSIHLKDQPSLDLKEIQWTVHADNATPQTGNIKLKDIPLTIKDESVEH